MPVWRDQDQNRLSPLAHPETVMVEVGGAEIGIIESQVRRSCEAGVRRVVIGRRPGCSITIRVSLRYAGCVDLAASEAQCDLQLVQYLPCVRRMTVSEQFHSTI